jgi:hypothetical protein
MYRLSTSTKLHGSVSEKTVIFLSSLPLGRLSAAYAILL